MRFRELTEHLDCTVNFLMRAVFGAAFISFIGLGVCPVGHTQQRDVTRDLQDEVNTLKKDVNALAQKQQQIVDQLNDLKRFVQPNPGSSPGASLPATVNILGELFKGDSDAHVAIIEFADFECPFCAQYVRETYPQIADSYIKTGKVKYFYRDFPLEAHPHAMEAARAARCAGEQNKFWEMHDNLFANQGALTDEDISGRSARLGIDSFKFTECLYSGRFTEEIRKSMSESQKMGINGTPTFFIGTIDAHGNVVKIEKTIMGTYPYEIFESTLNEVLTAKSPAAVSTH